MDPGLRRDDIAYAENRKPQTKEKGRFPGPLQKSIRNLALRELEGLAGLGLAVLLAFDDAAVAGQEAALLERRAQCRLEEVQGLGDAVTNGTGLAGQTTTGNSDDDVVLVGAFGRDDRLLDDQLQNGTGEVGGEFAAIDGRGALARLDPDAGDGILALAGGIGAALGVELLLMHRGGVHGRSDSRAAEVFEGV